MNDKMKITNCWTTPQDDESPNWCAPSPLDGFDPEERPAVIVWKEDYDRLLAGYEMFFEAMDSEFNMTDCDVLKEIKRRVEAKKGDQ